MTVLPITYLRKRLSRVRRSGSGYWTVVWPDQSRGAGVGPIGCEAPGCEAVCWATAGATATRDRAAPDRAARRLRREIVGESIVSTYTSEKATRKSDRVQ